MKKIKKSFLVLLTVCLVSGAVAGTALAAAGGATGGGPGYQQSESFKESKGKIYLYDADGKWIKKSGWYKIKRGDYPSVWVYIGKDGALYEGWNKIGGTWYFFVEQGSFIMSPGGVDVSQAGVMGSDCIVGNYALDKSGAMVTGWYKVTNEEAARPEWVYADKSGKLAKNTWKKIGGKWYYFGLTDKYSAPATWTGWMQIRMQTKWIKLGKSWYYLGSDGAMRTDWHKIGGKWYYFGSNGKMVTKWQKIDGKWYYFGTNGKMVTGKQKINGKTYTFNSKGVWVK